MTICIIRVELHDANSSDYDELASLLEGFGITDVIVSDDGLAYKMSPGEYNYDGPKTLNEIYTETTACADVVGRSYAVTASSASRVKWVGLKRVAR